MTDSQDDLFRRLLQAVDGPIAKYSHLDAYWYGKQSIALMAEEHRKLLGNRLGRLVSNIPRLTVLSIAERLRVQAFDGIDIWDAWEVNDLPQHSGTLFKEALLLGSAYVLVWAAPDGSPRVTVESAKQVSVERDPASGVVTSALKRWETRTTTEAALFLPDRVVRYSANSLGATSQGFRQVDVYDNPLGVVPMVPFVNADRLLDTEGASEIWDLIPLVDLANKLLVDLAVTSETTGLPRRWATGISPVKRPVRDAENNVIMVDGKPVMEYVNPVSPETYTMAMAEAADAKFGQWDAAELGGYEAAMRVVMGHIGAISSLPAAYLNMTNSQPTSADAVRAQESSLVARVEAKQLIFGPALEQVAALIVAVRDGVDPLSVRTRVRWGDPASRSAAQEADAAVKLYQANVLSRSEVLRTLGYTDEQISKIRSDLRAEALDGQGVNVTNLPSQNATPGAEPVAA